MEPEAIGNVLGVAAAFDNRTVGLADSMAWYRVVGHLGQGEVEDAIIAHYSETTDRIMPAHVLSRVGKLRALRIAHAGPEAVPDANPDDVHAYRAALREGRFVTASGLRPRPMIQAIEPMFQRVESKWSRALGEGPTRLALPPAVADDPDLADAQAILREVGGAHAWMIAARVELEAEGTQLAHRAVVIRAADLATRPESSDR